VSTEKTSIPQPRLRPIVGNLLDLDQEKGIFGLTELADTYGPLYRLQMLGNDLVVAGSQELVDELCDESRFDKALSRPLQNVRDFAGDGLFTAETQEPGWGAAHRILMPAFGPAALRTMFDGMVDIADQLLLKWERQGPAHRIDVADNTTRLTLDTIALCSFGYRFNSMYSDDMHPFVGAMVRSLVESGERAQRLPIQTRLMLKTAHQYDEDKRLMYEIADGLIAERRRHPSPEGEHDILDTMLTATDPQTGERLSDENVRYQLVTFLIAGHETTSGLLTFTLYELLRNPEILERAHAHVTEVLGNRAPTFADLSRLGYLDQILKETLRLWPTAPAFAVKPHADEVLGGRYAIPAGQTVLVLTPQLHRDPAVWGPDPEAFEPERFDFDRAKALPPNAWKPFGNGQRSCIGRGFALQEATLFLAMLLQRFDISAADPDYQLTIKQTLTIKPEGLFINVRRRPMTIVAATDAPTSEKPAGAPVAANGVPLRVLYGSNAGTSEAFAQRIANDGRRHGYTTTVDTLDSATGHLPAEGAVVIVCSSYEGQPPDNARAFVRWLTDLPDGALAGVRFAVFGNGNRDWARTYQAVPTAIDEQLARAGATRLVPRGEANARGDFFGDFDDWYAGFWAPVGAAFGQSGPDPAPAPQLAVEFVGAVRDPILRSNQLQLGTVVANRELVDMSAPGARSKRHLEIALPEGTTYRAGDYLAVLPLNPTALVDRALNRFGLAYDATTVIRAGQGDHTFLPVDTPVTAGELLSSYVELAQPATRRQIAQLADATVCPPEKRALQALADDADAHAAEIVATRVSVLDLLERYPACGATFATFLQMLAPLTPRQYSISSSPRYSPDHVTITVAVLSAPAFAGTGTYEGVASTYLARIRPGTRIAITVRPSNVGFHPPESPATPIVMACAGTGIAPFRGFLQDRALWAQLEGTKPAPALLFFGCDDPEVDYLYRDELADWAEAGIVEVHPAFSAIGDGKPFVQDRLWADRSDIVDLVRQGATFYVCGDGKHMAPAVFDTCARIYAEATGAGEEEAQEWMTAMQRDHARYVADVFA